MDYKEEIEAIRAKLTKSFHGNNKEAFKKIYNGIQENV